VNIQKWDSITERNEYLKNENKEFTVSITNAVSWARSKWQVCEVFDVSSVLITEPLRVKFLWIREVVWVMVESINRHPDHISRLQGETWFSWQSVSFHTHSVCQYIGRVHT